MKVVLQNNEEDCLLACYTMLLYDLGYHIPLYEVYNRDSIPADGLNVSYLLTLNKKYNVKIKAYRSNLANLVKLYYSNKKRMILYWNQEHFVVLEKVKKNKIIIVDPALGRISYTFQEVRQHFSNVVILVLPTENFEKRRVNDLFLKYLKKTINAKIIVTFLVSLILVQSSVLLFSIIIRNIMSYKWRFAFSIFLLVVIICFQILGYLIKNMTLLKYNKEFDNHYSNYLFEKLLNKPLLYYRNHTNGSISEKINFKTTLRDSISQKLIPSIISIFSGVIIFTYLMTVSKYLTLILFFMILMYGFFSAVLCKKQIEVNQSYVQSLIDFNSELQGDLDIVDYIKLTRQENVVQSHLERYNSNLTRQYSKVLKVDNKVQLVGTIFNFVSLSMVVIFAIYYNHFFNISFADLVLYQTSISILIASIEQIKNSLFEMSRLKVYAEKQGDLLKSVPKIKVSEKNNSEYLIEAKQLNFSYDFNNLYQPINLTIKRGEKVAIVGKSGSGKSTLILLLAGMLRYSGELYYGDSNLTNELGVVLQNMPLKKGSILDNLEYDGENYDYLKQVLKDTSAESVIDKLPNKLHSKLLKQGKNLSGGQVQKILIARSLLKGKSLIIWDEAFSNLDEVSKNKIYTNILQSEKYSDKTMLIVSHHLDIVHYVDKVIFVNNETGEVIKSTHEELLEKSQPYREFILN